MQPIINFNMHLLVCQLFVYQTIQISKMAANVYNRVLKLKFDRFLTIDSDNATIFLLDYKTFLN